MAKRKPEEVREITRKETHLRRKDAEANRRILLALAGVGILLVLLIVAGVAQELLIAPNQPVVTVNNQRLSTRDYQKLVKYAWFQEGQVTDPQGTSLTVLDEAIDNALMEEQAQQRGIAISDEEVTETIEKLFGYYRVPPTPVPTRTPAPEPTADPNATPSSEPTAIPTSTATPAPTATPVSLESFQTAYKNYLDRMNTATGMTEADFRALIRRDLIREKLYEDVTKDVPTTGEQVHARHILVSVRTPAPTRRRHRRSSRGTMHKRWHASSRFSSVWVQARTSRSWRASSRMTSAAETTAVTWVGSRAAPGWCRNSKMQPLRCRRARSARLSRRSSAII